MIREPDFLRRFWDGKDLQVLIKAFEMQRSLGERAAPIIRAGLLAYFDTEEARLQNLYLIETKRDGVMPLRFNETQRRLYEAIQEMRRDGLPVRLIIVKARQQGVSAFWQVFNYCQCESRPSTNALTINYDDPNAKELFGKAKFAHDNHPCAGEVVRDSAQTLEFAAPHYSKFYVRTAESPEVARGLTVHGIHASEIPLWRDPDTTFTAASQAVVEDPTSWIAKEATARGAQGHFYDAWGEAVDGVSGYRPFFSPWYWQREYTKEFRSPAERSAFMAGVTQEEREYKARYGLTWEQMYWRRWKTATDLVNNPVKFREEYPASAEEAFVSTGRGVFKHDDIIRIDSDATRPMWSGTIVLGSDKVPDLVPDPSGMLSIWDMPIDGEEYVVGADVAEGKVRDKGQSKGIVAVGRDIPDYSAAAVIELKSGRHVATWHGFIPPPDFAIALAAIGWFYNAALVVPEVNGPGLSVVHDLTSRISYPNVYVSKMFGGDREMSGETVNFGFRTTISTRPILINNLHRAVSTLRTRDRRVARELRNMEFDDQGVARARGKNKDDLVFAVALALQGRNESLSGTLETTQTQGPRGPDAEIWDRIRAKMKLNGLRSSDRDLVSGSFSGPGVLEVRMDDA